MPLLTDEAVDLEPRVQVGASVAVELDWALGAVFQPLYKREGSILGKVYEASPALAERARSFWGPEETTSWGSSIELQLLAHHAGLLISGPSELLGKLEEICADAPTSLRLASEPAPDRKALLARLTKLRSSASVRRRYVKLVRDIWSSLAPLWESQGRAAVAASVAWRAKLAGRGTPWREVAGNLPECFREELVRQLEGTLGPGGAVVVVPSYFASGRSVVDLSGTLLIGARAGAGLEGPQARARLEPLARQLKAVSDPTRLAVLEALSAAPATVGELAQRFAIAQPTASNHVKVLREAGLITNGSGSDRHKLAVEAGAAASLLDELGAAVSPSSRRAPRDGL